MNTVIKPPWIDDDEYLDFLQSYQKFQFFSKKYQNHPLIENFSKSKAVLLIYCSNKLENTLPIAAKQGDTHKLLCDILHDIDANINYTTWDADGGGDYSKIQMLQICRQKRSANQALLKLRKRYPHLEILTQFDTPNSIHRWNEIKQRNLAVIQWSDRHFRILNPDIELEMFALTDRWCCRLDINYFPEKY